jgi:hypothetical protein
MAPKYRPTPQAGGDRRALNKELGKSRAMANILAAQAAEMRAEGEAMIQQADKLLCESWNERMWGDGESIDPSPTIDQAVNGGFSHRSHRWIPWCLFNLARSLMHLVRPSFSSLISRFEGCLEMPALQGFLAF